MPDYYAVTVKVTFGVLADSVLEAEQLAEQLCPVEDQPVGSNLSYYAYLTPNQEPRIKREALNSGE